MTPDEKPEHPKQPEELFVNYCFQPEGSKLLLFPYGQGFGLINHNSNKSKINVELRWSTNHMNHATQWLDEDITLEQFFIIYFPGSTIIEAVATRDIREGEEVRRCEPRTVF